MVILLMGGNCTGKSSAAQALQARYGLQIYAGKDYLRLAKTESNAWAAFLALLRAAQDAPLGAASVAYVVAEPELSARLMEIRTKRILFTAELSLVQQRFAQRMGGTLPAPVAAMLTAKAARWATVPCDVRIDTTTWTAEETASAVIALLTA